MDRQKLLVWIVLSAVGLWLFDQIYFGPWSDEMRKLGDETAKMRTQVEMARRTVAARREAAADWKAVEDRIGKGRESDAVVNEFVAGLQNLSGVVGLQNWSTKVGRGQKTGDFAEHAVETSFQAGWEAFVRLLWDLRGWKDFIRVQRFVITSKYEKENRLDVEMRVSTIELAARGSAKQ